jgi:peroxiredoxin
MVKIGSWIVGVLTALNVSAKDSNNTGKSKKPVTQTTLRTAGDSLIRLQAITTARASVFIFLSPECPISQQCTKELEQLAQRFTSSGIAFYGVIPGSFYTKDEIAAFARTYRVSFPLLIDDRYNLTHQLNATITPEVVVVDSTGSVKYSGAVDNAYQSLGHKNARTTEHYLDAALTAIQFRKDILIRRTTPVGCLVEGTKKRTDE